jgi:hypothetical protein
MAPMGAVRMRAASAAGMEDDDVRRAIFERGGDSTEAMPLLGISANRSMKLEDMSGRPVADERKLECESKQIVQRLERRPSNSMWPVSAAPGTPASGRRTWWARR